ncbi:MAG: NAD(P)/FAD-dependent oxidoreductase [Gaiellaceae bacterium]
MRIVVIGGGVIGLACAWELHRRDHDVVVLEAATFGGGVSRGNAGWVCPSLTSPLAAPGMVREGIRQLLHGGESFRLRPRLDPTLVRWLVEFAWSCRSGPYTSASRALAELSRGTLELYDAYVDAGVELELHRAGLVIAARTEEKLAAYRRPGLVELDGRAAAELEPALDGDGIAGALFAESDRHVRPETLTRGLVKSLRERGADLREHSAVRSVARRGSEWVVNGDLAAGVVVVAAGLGSARLVRMNTPLVGARGYSVEVTGVRPSHALYLAEAKLALSPFDDAVRLAGVLELGRPTGMTQTRLLGNAARYLANAPVARGELWSGFRPATPTGVPVVELLEPGLVVAAGHGTLGITLAPAPAVRVASLI